MPYEVDSLGRYADQSVGVELDTNGAACNQSSSRRERSRLQESMQEITLPVYFDKLVNASRVVHMVGPL
ncbi:hypothetical protein KFL_000500470 [Klebsormidium nitens]|uniref:Uncharacterized protein n=1 Tax=Klebsormidium nitens TaxID=105231 RepID=A0A1Y1HQD6_KLENI|nr:hypothetical protein KFL_000500470 [Klebsormidium nitens]|eukprot:GAQ80293.1 hypothetical protein KFL_000500470 [Klebsormidium nitens]